MIRRWSLLLLLLSIGLSLAVEETESSTEFKDAEDPEGSGRVKRFYDYSGYGGGTDFWYAGRVVGIIAGLILLLLCCCVPCICLLGVWFLGWFGFRQVRGRNQRGVNDVKVLNSRDYPAGQYPPAGVRSGGYPSGEGGRHPTSEVVYTAEDRYFASRSPPRDDPYKSTRF